jgi:hypothetical protein
MVKDREQKSDSVADNQKYNKYLKRIIVFVTQNDKFIIAISTIFIAVFTITLFIATWLLWVSGEQHAERQLRAYIFIDSMDVKNVAVNQKSKATVIFKNSGQTPAYGVNIIVGIDFREYPLTSDLDPLIIDQIKPKPKSNIPPGGTFNTTLTHDKTLTSVEVDQLNDSTHAIYVTGEIIYKDAFGKRRSTKFLVFNNKSTASDLSSLTPYSEGNEAN